MPFVKNICLFNYLLFHPPLPVPNRVDVPSSMTSSLDEIHRLLNMCSFTCYQTDRHTDKDKGSFVSTDMALQNWIAPKLDIAYCIWKQVNKKDIYTRYVFQSIYFLYVVQSMWTNSKYRIILTLRLLSMLHVARHCLTRSRLLVRQWLGRSQQLQKPK